MTGHRVHARSLPPAPVRTGLGRNQLRPPRAFASLSRCTDAAMPPRAGSGFTATRRTWRSTMHIAYLRGRAALKCP